MLRGVSASAQTSRWMTHEATAPSSVLRYRLPQVPATKRDGSVACAQKLWRPRAPTVTKRHSVGARPEARSRF